MSQYEFAARPIDAQMSGYRLVTIDGSHDLALPVSVAEFMVQASKDMSGVDAAQDITAALTSLPAVPGTAELTVQQRRHEMSQEADPSLCVVSASPLPRRRDARTATKS